MTSFAQHILIVDDDAGVRSALADVLRNEGHSVVEAASGPEALALFRDDPCRVVITDIRMPGGLDGIGLLEEIRRIDERTKVIIMTTFASTDTSIKALKLGAYDYVTKPFDDVHLVAQATRRAYDAVKLAEERDLLVASLTRNNAELARLNRVFRDLAIRDGLTGVHNHRHFQESLKKEVLRARRYHRELSVIFIDVDHFKHYNDTHGHQKGDELLVVLAGLLERHVRSADMVARWGGEEFVVMAPETSLDDCLKLAENLRRHIFDHDFAGEEQQPGGNLTVSMGVASLRVGGDDHELVHRADEALYAAKDSGRNKVCAAP